MKSTLGLIAFVVCCSLPVFADGLGDNHPAKVRAVPKAGVEVPAADREKMERRLAELADKLGKLDASKDAKVQRLIPDVEIFQRAVRCALEFNEFLSPKAISIGHQLLQVGHERADQLLTGNAPWTTQTGLVVRGFRSKIDHTVQPYGLVIPYNYSAVAGNKIRCDVWLHGRGENDMEVNFIQKRMKDRGRFTPANTIVLHPYGRYSNAFKFAGEVDVLEALDHVKANYQIDNDRISIRGFSMGGAGCWQFAVHYADQWFAANPGAGFSETPEFLKSFQKETLTPTWFEKKLWNMYDCDKYAVNILQCPTVAYSGELDIQKQAADVMEKAYEPYGKLVHLIGPKTKHTIHKDSMIEIERRMDSLAEIGRKRFPEQIAFSTHTLKYNQQNWITINGLKEHWKPAFVGASIRQQPESSDSKLPPLIKITADNVTDISINFPPGHSPFEQSTTSNAWKEWSASQYPDVTRDKAKMQPIVVINGEPVSIQTESDGSLNGRFIHAIQNRPDRKTDSISEHATPIPLPATTTEQAKRQPYIPLRAKWVSAPASTTKLVKHHNLQGPIDDAFMDSFIMVPPESSGDSKFDKWAQSEFDRAVREWRRHFRGDARVKSAADITDADIASANIVLWGNKASNPLIAKIADKLPIIWRNNSIYVGNKKYSEDDHALSMIYPNPLNHKRYVVLNSGFTYREYAYLNNARQVPMLPDWAIINLDTPPGSQWPGKVVDANFFDETWQLKAAPSE